MIIQNSFEVLQSGYGRGGTTFIKENQPTMMLGDLVTKSKDLCSRWKNSIIDNGSDVNFSLGDDLKFRYMAKTGEKKEADISEYAFGQLCTRVGVPASYVKKCIANNKTELALHNFHQWADETDSGMLVREHNGVVKAVLSDSYTPFDSYKVLRNLKYVVDENRWKLTQYFLSEEKLFLRFVDFTPLPVDDGSPLYVGVSVASNDVGQGSLNIKVFIYRQVCSNGMIVSSVGGTLFKQSHIGADMSDSKLTIFNRAFSEVDTLKDTMVSLIGKNRVALQDYEMAMYLEKAKRELKLSKIAFEKLELLVNSEYEQTKWGVINGITELAQDFTLDTRIEMETWAGELFAKVA